MMSPLVTNNWPEVQKEVSTGQAKAMRWDAARNSAHVPCLGLVSPVETEAKRESALAPNLSAFDLVALVWIGSLAVHRYS